MTLYAGIRAGLQGGIRTGINPAKRDGPSNWFTPELPSEFAALGLATPDYLWLCQEASGDLASTIGSLSLTANATGHLYQQSVAGWTRKFVGLDGVTADQSWRTSSALLDLSAGQSAAMLGLVSFATPSNNRVLASLASGNENLNVSGPDGFVRTVHAGVAANGTIAHGGINTVHQFCWYRNGTTNNSGSLSELEAVAGTHNESARTGAVKGLGHVASGACASSRYGWFAIFRGANAEQDWPAYLATMRGE